MTNTLQTFSSELADLAASAGASVVRVDARQRMPASGVAWTDELIVTAHHVVESDDDILVVTPDGERLDAQLLGRDPRNDLALLRGGRRRLASRRTWADEDALRVGDICALALGRPAAADQSGSFAIISGHGGPVPRSSGGGNGACKSA